MSVPRDLAEFLVCPVDRLPLRRQGDRLVSSAGRAYPVIESVPVLLVPEVRPTIGIAQASLEAAEKSLGGATVTTDDLLQTLGVSDAGRARARILMQVRSPAAVDPFVSVLVGATSGFAYQDVIGKLERVPIPAIPPAIDTQLGEVVLDIGCNWGRWSMAAGADGKRTVIGVDPSLGAVIAARRVAAERGVNFYGVVADARHLPFADVSFDGVISYSVLQHFSGEDLASAVAECRRVLRPGAVAAVQMASRNGIRSLFHLARRGFRSGSGFEVRYWTPGELKRIFGVIGRPDLMVDCFFGLGLQATDADIATKLGRRAIHASEWLKRRIGVYGAPTWVADSLWVLSRASGR